MVVKVRFLVMVLVSWVYICVEGVSMDKFLLIILIVNVNIMGNRFRMVVIEVRNMGCIFCVVVFRMVFVLDNFFFFKLL